MRTLGIVAAVLIVLAGTIGFAALWWWAGRAVERDQGKRSINQWRTGNGWRHTTGTDGLLDRFDGPPFDHGTSRDVQDLLAGDPRALGSVVVLRSEAYRAKLSVMAYGRLADQQLADTLTALACDLYQRLPPEALAYRW